MRAMVLILIGFFIAPSSWSLEWSAVQSEVSTLENEEVKKTLQTLLENRKQIEEVLREKAVVQTRETNFLIQGKLTGSLNGKLTEHSPLAMMTMGSLLGTLAGAMTLGPVFDVLLLLGGTSALIPALAAGAGVGGVVGGVATPFLASPTLEGEFQGKIEGSLQGEGVQISEKANLFGVAVMNPEILEAYEGYLDGNKDQAHHLRDCEKDFFRILVQLREDDRVLSPEAFQAFLGALKSYNQGLDQLLEHQTLAFDDDELVRKIDEFRKIFLEYVSEKRVSLVDFGGKRPEFDFYQHTVLVHRSDRRLIYEKQPRVVARAGLTYTRRDFDREYNQRRSILESNYPADDYHWYRVQGLRLILPKKDRFGNRVVYRTSDWPRSVQGMNEELARCDLVDDRQNASSFLGEVSRSFDFFLNYPIQELEY